MKKKERERNQAKQNYLNLEKYFFSSNLTKIPKHVLTSILNSAKTKEIIKKEFSFMKKITKKEGIDTKESEYIFFLMANKFNIQTIVSSIIFFINQFQ